MIRESQADVMAKLLVDLGVAVTKDPANPDWQAISFAKPDKPDRVVVVYPTAGVIHGLHQDDGSPAEHYGIQIYVRDKKDRDAWAKAYDIIVALQGVRRRVVSLAGGSQYRVGAFTRTSGPVFMGRTEQDNLTQYTVNGLVSITGV